MTAIDTWRTIITQSSKATGPTDREWVAALQRVASARSHLAHAEQQHRLAPTPVVDPATRNREIELARTDLLWAQAGVLDTPRSVAANRALVRAEAAMTEVLERHGFTSYADYRARRDHVPTIDVHLMLARREHQAAIEAWQALQEASANPVVIDLTGDEPRLTT